MAPAVGLEPLRNGVLALAAAVLLLALFLVLERSIALITRLRVGRRESALTRLVYRVLQNPTNIPPEFGRLRRFDRKLVRSILLGLALDLRGETGDAIAMLYRRLGFLKGDLTRLNSWRAVKRASAAADLGLIHFADAVPALLHALSDTDIRVRQAAVWAVGQVGSPTSLASLVRLLGDPSLTVSHRVQEVLAERGREVVDAIINYAGNTASRGGRLAAIELIGWLRITTGTHLLLGFMTDMDPEVRVKTVKAAAAIGDPGFLQVFHAGLQDSSWPVRCQAAKGLSLIGSPESVQPLSVALRDDQWWVRFYAATALAELGPPGEEELNRALQDPRPEVRDMARYLLERGDVVPALP
jgi:HEAT repeat protein